MLGIGLTKLIEEVGSTLSRKRGKILCKGVLSYQRSLDLHLLLLLWLLLNLLAEEVFNLKSDFLPVLAKFTEHYLKVTSLECFQCKNFKFFCRVRFFARFLVQEKG